MSSNNYPTEAKNSLSSIGNTILNEIVKEYEIEPQDAKSKWQSMVGMSTNQKVSQQEVALLSIGKHREKMKVIMLGEHFFRGRYRSLTKLTTLKDEENGGDEFTTELKRHAIATLAILNSKDEDEDMSDASNLDTTPSTTTNTNTTSDSTAAVESSGTAGSGDNAVELEDLVKKLQLEIPPSFKDPVYEWVTSVSKMWALFETVAAKETKGMKSLDASNHVQKLKKVLMKSPTEHDDLAKIKKDVTDPVFHKIVKHIDNFVEENHDPSILGDELAKKMKIVMKDSIMKTLLMHAYIPVE